jgi:endonuclease/exonuclease/phosphatase family metal-dependent hydrolase
MRPLFTLWACLVLMGCATSDPRVGWTREASHLVVASFNIHYIYPPADSQWWNERKHAVSAMLGDINADIVLFQEMETFTGKDGSVENWQLDWVRSQLPDYAVAAWREDASQFPSTQPILYKSSQFRLLNDGFFAFSDTPEVAYSKSWAGLWPSFFSWALLEEISSKRQIMVVNTHLDVGNAVNQTKGNELIRQKIAQRSAQNARVILGGDFNTFADDKNLDYSSVGLVRYSSRSPSFHFRLGWHFYGAIDHFFFSKDWKEITSGALARQWNDVWPSDHHPIIVVLTD